MKHESCKGDQVPARPPWQEGAHSHEPTARSPRDPGERTLHARGAPTCARSCQLSGVKSLANRCGSRIDGHMHLASFPSRGHHHSQHVHHFLVSIAACGGQKIAALGWPLRLLIPRRSRAQIVIHRLKTAGGQPRLQSAGRQCTRAAGHAASCAWRLPYAPASATH